MTVRNAMFLAVACLGVMACVSILCSQPPMSWGRAARHTSVAISPDGTTIATAGGDDGTIHLREAGTGKERATLTGHQNQVTALLFTPDGKGLVSASYDKTVKVWDVSKP